MLGHHCESRSHRRSRTKKDLKDHEAQHLAGQDRFADCGNSFISTINNCSVNSSRVQPVSSEPHAAQGNSKCGPSSIYHKIDKLRRMLLASGGSLLAMDGVGNSGGGTGADSRRPAEAGPRAPQEAPLAEAAALPPLQAGVRNSPREQHQFQEMETKPERMSPPDWRPEDPPPVPLPECDEAPPPADPPPTAYATPPAADPPPDGYPTPPPEDLAQEGCAALPPNVRRPWRCPLCRLSFTSSAFLDHQCQTESRKRAAPGKRHPGDAISKKSRQQPTEPHDGLPAAEGGGSGVPPALGTAVPASPLPEAAPPSSPPPPPAEPPPSPDVGESSWEQQYEDFETKEGKMSPPGTPPGDLAAAPPEKPPPDSYAAPPPEDTPRTGYLARPPKPWPYQCFVCDKWFTSHIYLYKHFKSANHRQLLKEKELLSLSAEERRRQQPEGARRGEPEPGGAESSWEQQYEDFDTKVGKMSPSYWEAEDPPPEDYEPPPPVPTPDDNMAPPPEDPLPEGGAVRPARSLRCSVCKLSFKKRWNLWMHCRTARHQRIAQEKGLPAEPVSKRSWPSGRGSRKTTALPPPAGVASSSGGGRPPELRPTAPRHPPPPRRPPEVRPTARAPPRHPLPPRQPMPQRLPPPEPPLLWGPPPEQPPDIGNSFHRQVCSSQRLTPADSGAPAYPVQLFRRADTYERQQHAVSGAFEGLLRRLLETDTSEQPFALQMRQGGPQSQQEEKRLRLQQEGHSLDLRHLLQQQQLVPGSQVGSGLPSLPAPDQSARGSAVVDTGSATGQSVPPFCNGGTKGNSRQDEQQNAPQKVIKKMPPAPSLQQSPSVPAGFRRLQPAWPNVTIRASESVPLLWPAPPSTSTDGPRICPICGGAFSWGYSLREHVRCFHPGSEYIECEVCGVAFAVLEEYRAHLAEYAGIGAGKRHPADECPKSTANATHPVRHEEVNSREQPYLCAGRPDRYRNEECPARRERLRAGEGRFQCDECPEHFSTKTLLKRHKLKHSGVRSYSKRRFQCNECPDHYPSKALLKRHKLYHCCVRSYSEGRFQCDECPMHYATKTILKRHKLKHLGMRPYSCHICHQRFYRKDHLRIHLNKIHS